MNSYDERRIGLIGCGLIGRKVIEALAGGDLPGWTLATVLARRGRCVEGFDVLSDADRFFAEPLDLIIEAAGPQALATLGPRALQAAEVWAVSGAALASQALIDELRTTGAASGNRLRLLPGAIAALDGVAATAQAPDSAVHVYVDLVPSGEHDEIVFNGSAREAAVMFPNHVNVTVAAALAGLGLDRTEVTVRQRPAGEPHAIQVVSSGRDGSVNATTYPVVNPGQRIHIVASSIVAALRTRGETIWVG